MTPVSTSATLFLKLVLPTVWTTFFVFFTFALFQMDFEYIGPFPGDAFRIAMLIFTLIGVIILYFLVMRIKRVDMDDSFMYVTNYFKTYRYPFHQIEKIEERSFGLFRAVDVTLKEAGKFGEQITFFASRRAYDRFISEHPNAFQHLLKGKKRKA